MAVHDGVGEAAVVDSRWRPAIRVAPLLAVMLSHRVFWVLPGAAADAGPTGTDAAGRLP